MWSHAQWDKRLFSQPTTEKSALRQYSEYFNSVEGNTSFYQMSEESTSERWASQVPHDFRFTFKFHQSISHQGQLDHNIKLAQSQLAALNPLRHQLGLMLLQLPASFSPKRLLELEGFLSAFSEDVDIAVEVRDLAFFNKDDVEAEFNRLLQKYNASRVVMDTRGLFSVKNCSDPMILEVQKKKPKVPTNVVSTNQTCVVRYVGHPNLADNHTFYLPWIHKLHQWFNQGKQVYFFFHMPDNALAPWLAEQFLQDYRKLYPEDALPNLVLPKADGGQIGLF